jgi:hypothetical protein
MPAAQRWPWSEMVPLYKPYLDEAIGLINQFVPSYVQPVLEDGASYLLTDGALGSYGEEIEALCQVAQYPLGVGALLNIIYEVEAGCTR